MSIIVGTINSPAKGYLLDAPDQAAGIARLLNEHHVDACGLQEVYTGLRRRFQTRQHPWLGIVSARPNNLLRWTQLGNSVLYRRGPKAEACRVISKRSLTSKWVGNPRGLSMCVVLLEVVATGERITVISAHLPTKSNGTQAAWDRMAREIHAYTGRIMGAVAIVLDSNRDAGTTARAFPSFRRANTSGVDHILVRGARIIESQDVPLGRISDHPHMVIAELEVTDRRTQRRLPPTSARPRRPMAERFRRTKEKP